MVDGGAGFIGSHLVRGLLNEGHEVTILDDLSRGSLMNVPNEARFVKGSILEQDIVDEVMKDVDYVFHLAAKISVPESMKNPNETFNVNIKGTSHIIKAAIDAGVKRMMFASSAAVYGNTAPPQSELKTDHLSPTSPYGMSKLLSETMLRDYALDNEIETVSLRYFNVYGTGQLDSVVVNFVARMTSGEPPMVFGDGKRTRDFVHVSDVVRANMMAMKVDKEKAQGNVYNIGTGKETTINELVDILNEVLETDIKPRYMKERDVNDTTRSCATVALAKKELGFVAKVKLKEGLKEMI